MPLRQLTKIFEYLTSLSSVQIRLQYGLQYDDTNEILRLKFTCKLLVLQPIPVFFKCVHSAVHISQICFHVKHVPAMVCPTYTMTGGTAFPTTLISTPGQSYAA